MFSDQLIEQNAPVRPNSAPHVALRLAATAHIDQSHSPAGANVHSHLGRYEPAPNGKNGNLDRLPVFPNTQKSYTFYNACPMGRKPQNWDIWTPSNTRLLEPKAHPSLHPVSVSIASASLTVRTKPTDYTTTRQSRAIGRLRSSFTQQLLVPPYRLSTVGCRSFSVAASTFWNTLPNDIQSAPSLSSFRRQLDIPVSSILP